MVGNGLDSDVTMGPVITPQSKARIEALIETGIDEGASAVLDGRNTVVSGCERGFFVGPTILAGVHPDATVARTEIFTQTKVVIERWPKTWSRQF